MTREEATLRGVNAALNAVRDTVEKYTRGRDGTWDDALHNVRLAINDCNPEAIAFTDLLTAPVDPKDRTS